MKKYSQIILLSAILMFCSFILIGCNSNKNTQLDPPHQLNPPQLYYENGTVKWDKIGDAEKYEVLLNDDVYITYNNYFNLPLTENTQNFNICVKSISQKLKDSDFSEKLSFSAKIINAINSFNIDISNTIDNVRISWTKTNCEKYRVIINKDIYESTYNYFNSDSSFYVTGNNEITIQPIGTTFDVIPKPITKHVEKSNPLSNVYNIRVENGELMYGENEIYDTSQIKAGDEITIKLCNIEANKIRSDGPTYKTSKVSSPYISHFYKNNELKHTIVTGDIEGEFDYLSIKIYHPYDTDCIITANVNVQNGHFYFYTDNVSIYYNATNVEIVAYKEGWLHSNIVKQ